MEIKSRGMDIFSMVVAELDTRVRFVRALVF